MHARLAMRDQSNLNLAGVKRDPYVEKKGPSKIKLKLGSGSIHVIL